MLHGVTTGFTINSKLPKRVFKQLLEDEEFLDELFILQNELNFKYNRYLLFKGKIQVYTLNENLSKIESVINDLINNQVSKSLCVDVKNYTFKPLLNSSNNILGQLQNKFQVTIDFSIQTKKVFIYGNHDQTLQCKEKLLQLLISEQNQTAQEECNICFDSLKEKFILSLCGHYFCKQCLFDSIKQSESTTRICPQCLESISLQDLQCLFCEIDFDKFLNQSFKNYKTINQDQYVQCNTPDCEEYFKTLPEDQPPFYYCESCLQSFCSKCKNFAHPKITCEEAKSEFKGDKPLTEEEMKKMNIKTCPKCSFGVQKNKGCNHMTCSQCKNHWCWLCMHQANNDKDIYDHIHEMHPGQLFDANDQ